MTHEEFNSKLEAIPSLELAEMAQIALSKLCKTGGRSFEMSVPPRIDNTDMVLSEVIRRFKLLNLEVSKNCMHNYDASEQSEQLSCPLLWK